MINVKDFVVRADAYTEREQQYLLDLAVNAGAGLKDFRKCTGHQQESDRGLHSLLWPYFGVVGGKTYIGNRISGAEILNYKAAENYLKSLIGSEYKFKVGDFVVIKPDVSGVTYANSYFGETGVVKAYFVNTYGYNVYAVEFSGGSLTVMEKCLEHKKYTVTEVFAKAYLVECPKCGNSLETRKNPAGAENTCRNCGSIINVCAEPKLVWGE